MARPAGIQESKPRVRRGENLTKVRLVERIARLERLGVLAGTARRVLAAVGDDRYWLEVIGRLEDDMDYKTIAGIMQYQQSMRDGRPHQNINISSIGISFSADEVSKARAIVRELMPPLSLPVRSEDSAKQHNGLGERRGQEKVE